MLNKLRTKKIDVSSLTLYIGAVLILLIFTILCAVNGKNFLTMSNITNIIVQSAIIGVTAISASLVILTGGIDLSIGSVVGFTGIFAGVLIKAGVPIVLAILICLVIGCIVGYGTGIFVSYGKIPAFIVTLGTMQILRGITKIITGGKPVAGLPVALAQLTTAKILGIPLMVFYLVILYAFMFFILKKTKFGRKIYAIGGNVKAAKLSGVKVNQIEAITYLLAALFSTLAGILLLSRLCYADPNAGSGYEMNAIAAAVLGGIAMSGGKGNLLNTLVGAIILGMLTCGLQILNVPTYYQTVITGVVIIIAVYFDKAKDRKAE